LWYYSRVLWDNSFCIPVAGLAFAAYVAFLDRERLSSFALVIASLWVLTLTHLMSVALTLPIALHMAIARRRALWRYKWTAIAISAVAIGVTYSYWAYLFAAPGEAAKGPSTEAWLFPVVAPRYFGAQALEYLFAWLFPLLVPQFFSAQGLEYFFGNQFAWTGG